MEQIVARCRSQRMGTPDDLMVCVFSFSRTRRPGSPARSSTSTAARCSDHAGAPVRRLHRAGPRWARRWRRISLERPGGLMVCDAPARSSPSFGAAGASVARLRPRWRRVGRRHLRHGARRRSGARRRLGPDGSATARPGTVVAIHSTIRAGTAERWPRRLPAGTTCSSTRR